MTYTYFLYPSIVFLLSRSFRKEAPANGQTLPTVSIVVSVYNEESVLAGKLKNLATLEYPPEKIQFLFGSDGSADGTNQILKESTMPRVEVQAFAERRGKAIVLNDLVSAAHGEIVVFSDANTMFRPDTVRCLVRHFSDGRVGAVSGELKLIPDLNAVGTIGESSYWDYENLLKKMESDYRTILGATGGVYAIRRSLFKPLPMHKAITDDLLIPLNVVKQGYTVKYERQALAFETSARSVGEEFRRKARIGAQNFATISEFAPLLHPRAGFVAFALWSHKILRWCVPFLLLGLGITVPLLASANEFYWLVSVGTVLFLGVAMGGFLLEKSRLDVGILTLPYYFLAMNLALFLGFVRFLLRREKPMWTVVRS